MWRPRMLGVEEEKKGDDEKVEQTKADRLVNISTVYASKFKTT